MLGKAWALNEKVEAARPHAKIKAIFAIVTFPVHDAVEMSDTYYHIISAYAGGSFSGRPPSRITDALPSDLARYFLIAISVLAEMESKGAIKIAGAMYSVETGVVDFFPV